MTISSVVRKAGPFAGNGVATTFPFAFKVFDKTDVKALLVNATGTSTPLTLDSDYSVVLNANQDTGPGGSIIYPITGVPLPAGYSLVLLGDLPYDQETNLTNSGGFYPSVIEDMSDRSTIQIQQLAEVASRAIVYNESESISPVLPTAAARANTVLGFDALGQLEVFPLPASIGAGDLKNESWTDGTDYTAGTSTSVTLSRAYATKANLGSVVMQGIAQDPTLYSLNGLILTFLDGNGNPTAIPLGVGRIWCIGGTTLSVSVTPDNSVTDAKVAPSAGIQTTKSSYTSSYATKPRVLTAKLDDIPDIRDFYIGGPVGTGNDDTSAMTAAHATGLMIDYPDGTFIFSNFTLSAGGIRGRGKTQTILQSFDTSSADLIKWNGPGQLSYNGALNGPSFEKFQINVPGTKTGGASLLIAPSVGEVSFFDVDGVAFLGGWTQLGMTSASHWNVRGSKFLNFNQAGILAQNINNVDSGDASVMGCTFNTNFASALNNQAGILQRSGTNLKVTGNKFLGANWGYFAQMALAGVGVAGLQFVGNSVENQALGGMNFTRLSGTAGMGGVNITGNEFGLSPLHIVANDSSGFLSDVNISSNTFAQIRTGDVGVTLDYVTSAYVGGNKFSGNSGTGVGISTGANLVAYHQGINKYRNLGTPYGIGSPAQSIIDQSPQNGTAVVTLNAAYGTLFVGTVVITFPQPFLVTPTQGHAFVQNGANAGLSCAVTGLSQTQMSVAVFGVTNGANVPISWDAWGTV